MGTLAKQATESLPIVFQFPTNGKAHGNNILVKVKTDSTHVSISYKRESTWERRDHRRTNTISIQVSIPYKRESTSEPLTAHGGIQKEKSFNSLQTGKHF